MLLRKALFAQGYRYRLHVNKLPGKPDIVLSKHKMAIFVHGCFWHRHTNCKAASFPKSNLEYWIPKFSRNVEKDIAQQEALKSNGWRVFVVWECQLKKDLENVINRIAKSLKD